MEVLLIVAYAVFCVVLIILTIVSFIKYHKDNVKENEALRDKLQVGPSLEYIENNN